MIFPIYLPPNVTPLIQPILTIKDGILHLTAAWEKLSSTVIAQCWRSFLEEEFSDEDDVPLSVFRDNLRDVIFQSLLVIVVSRVKI